MKEDKLMRLALIQMSDSGSVESNIEKSLNAMKEAGDTCRKNQIMAVPNIYLLEMSAHKMQAF